MKNILNLYLIIFCLFFVAGCSSDDDAATVKLTIIKSDLDMKASGGTGTVEFAATGTVTATVNADWCQVIEVADHKVSISVDANTGYPGRSAQIVLTDGVSTQQATILQEGAIWKYNRDATYFTLTDAAEEVPVEMSSNLPIQVSIPADASQWLSYEMTSDGFKFIATENLTGKIRSAIVKVTTGIREIEYALLQYDYNDTIMTLYINKNDKETKSTGASLDGKEIETIKLPEGEASIQVKRIMAKGDKKASYVAYWNNSTEFYQIESQMEEKEFIKLIKNIKF